MSNIKKTEGIILRIRDVTESSCIVKTFTEEYGTVSFLAKGARRPGKNFMGKLDMFYINEFVFYYRPDTDLYILSDCDTIYNFMSMRADVRKFALAAFMLESLENGTQYGQDKEFYRWVKILLKFLDTSYDEIIKLLFEIKYLEYLGRLPDSSRCNECKRDLLEDIIWSASKGIVCRQCSHNDGISVSRGAMCILERIRNSSDLRQIKKLSITEAQKNILEKCLRLSIDFILSKRLKSISFLDSMRLSKVVT